MHLTCMLHLNKTEILNFLARLPVFKAGSLELIESIYYESTFREYPIGAEILHEGAASNDEGFVILSGEVNVLIDHECVAVLGRGEVFGEYAPVFRQDRSATVRVSETLRCMVLSKRSLLRLVGHGCGLNRIMFKRIAENRGRSRGVFKSV